MPKKELERKHREEQEATALAFQEFIKTFQDNSGPPNKTFVRSAVLNANTEQEIESRGQIYNPQPVIKPTSNATIKNAIECARLIKEAKLERSKEKPKTNLEILKEELKLRHQERNERVKAKDDLDLYSFSASTDASSTNLFIAHISPKLTEQNLILLFGAYGPLASVKIMWPRLEERNETSNCGFVAFMSRKDAERAMCDLKVRENMRINWGKPVELPSNPIYIPPELQKLSHPPPYTGLPFNAQPLKRQLGYPTTTEEEMQDILYNSVVKVVIPSDRVVLMTINRMIEFVIREGPLFEAMMMNRELNNQTYQFLFNNRSVEHVYYRWRLYSLMHGETFKKWSTKHFRMFKNGSLWCPPIMQDYTKGMADHLINRSYKVNKSMLSDAQKTRFIELIHNLNLSKKKVGEVMMFCLNHIHAACEVIEIVIDCFMNPSTKAPKKIARLYLLSDILYNSGMRTCYAPVYRTAFEKYLPEIFKQLQTTMGDLQSVVDKEAYKRRVLSVLRSWDLWKIYPSEFLNNLENTFLCLTSDNDYDDSCDEPLDGANLIKRSIQNGAQPIFNDNTNVTNKQDLTLSGFIPSKWETVDPEQLEAQAMSTKKFYDMELERQKKKMEDIASQTNKELSNEERDMLRKVELLVMHYQDDIETGKKVLRKGGSLQNELDKFRNHLLRKLKKEREREKRRSSVSSDYSSDTDEKENLLKHKRKRNKRDRRSKHAK